ncbi:5-deoxy-glucuronate isomerase [Streptomyces sp. NPDC060006]|uniref:5-deoxy-glucuronate isomerase n=1 Tax=unclassified Streptomyces TaxID=2593676 RepID=UPI0036C0CC84
MTHEPYVPEDTAAQRSVPRARRGRTRGGRWVVEPEAGGGERTVPPSESGCTVRAEGNKEGKVFELLGRERVFAEVTDFTHAPRDARAQNASGAESRFALAGAKCERRLPARYGSAPEVPHTGRPRPPGAPHPPGAAPPGAVGAGRGRAARLIGGRAVETFGPA